MPLLHASHCHAAFRLFILRFSPAVISAAFMPYYAITPLILAVCFSAPLFNIFITRHIIFTIDYRFLRHFHSFIASDICLAAVAAMTACRRLHFSPLLFRAIFFHYAIASLPMICHAMPCHYAIDYCCWLLLFAIFDIFAFRCHYFRFSPFRYYMPE